MRIVEVITDAANKDALSGMAEHYAADLWWGAKNEDGRRSFRMLVDDDSRQSLIDALHGLLDDTDGARILILPVDAVLPRPREEDDDETANKRKSIAATREELYSEIVKGTKLDSNFLLLTFLSTIVAAIGLVEDNVAVVIGAMVIAPLLGPNIALAFAASLGDRELMWQALKTNAVGLSFALMLSLVIGMVWPLSVDSNEILARTEVGMASVVLALASGAAAVLSLTTGLSTTLVGVMVAVALLPPATILGMLLGSGQPGLANGAALLLAVNIVCVLLSAMMVFLAKGIKPRTWLERNRAKQSMTIYFTLWATLLLILITIILIRGTFAN